MDKKRLTMWRAQLRQELIARIEGELKQYINKPHDINRVNSVAFAQGHMDMVNGRNAKQFLTQVQISPFVFSPIVAMPKDII